MHYLEGPGLDCQLTLRGIDAAEVLTLAEQLMAKMAGVGVESAPGPQNGNGNGAALVKPADVAWCSIHDCAMDRYEKNGRSRHSRRIEGGKWCKGR